MTSAILSITITMSFLSVFIETGKSPLTHILYCPCHLYVQLHIREIQEFIILVAKKSFLCCNIIPTAGER
jgi:hypothetical protein